MQAGSGPSSCVLLGTTRQPETSCLQRCLACHSPHCPEAHNCHCAEGCPEACCCCYGEGHLHAYCLQPITQRLNQYNNVSISGKRALNTTNIFLITKIGFIYLLLKKPVSSRANINSFHDKVVLDVSFSRGCGWAVQSISC